MNRALHMRLLAFVLASACAIATLGYVTIQSLRLETREITSRAHAEHEASVRLVLWRMDSMLAPILAREAATPYFYYQPFFEASTAYGVPAPRVVPTRVLPAPNHLAPTSNATKLDLQTLPQSGGARDATAEQALHINEPEPIQQLASDNRLPSPLLRQPSPLVNLYFVNRDGEFTSPQIPQGQDRALAESNYVSTYDIENAASQLKTLERAWNSQPTTSIANQIANQIAIDTDHSYHNQVAVQAPTQLDALSAGNASATPSVPASDIQPLMSNSSKRGNSNKQSLHASVSSPAPAQDGTTQIPNDSSNLNSSQQHNSQQATSQDYSSQSQQPITPATEARPTSHPNSAPSASVANQTVEGNDYQQRANVAQYSKLAQAEAQRQRNLWSRKDSPSEKTSPAVSTPAGSTPAGSTPAASTPAASTPTASSTLAPSSQSSSQSDTAPPTPTSTLFIASSAASNEKISAPEIIEADTLSKNVALISNLDDSTLSPTPAHQGVQSGSIHGSRQSTPVNIPAAQPLSNRVTQGPLTPRWLSAAEPTLILVRDVQSSTGDFTQGIWLNWPELQSALMELAHDVFPTATLRPVPGSIASLSESALSRCLATIPVELVVPKPTPASIALFTPVRAALGMAWLVALGAIAASAIALRSATELAERRGQFVSAVTHELRTPLTTFCLYSQMLSDGMVIDPSAQTQYHATLHRESQRLTRIVESVLEYARLGKRKHQANQHPKPDATSIATVLDALAPSFKDRCQAAGMNFVESRTGDTQTSIRIDRVTLERILFNLVDNACKYASGASPNTIELHATTTSSSLILRVRDHGPGISLRESRRVFEPFFRGSKQADGAVAGLGLGLALSHTLARELGGELALLPTPSGGGAEFRLTLPLDRA